MNTDLVILANNETLVICKTCKFKYVINMCRSLINNNYLSHCCLCNEIYYNNSRHCCKCSLTFIPKTYICSC